MISRTITRRMVRAAQAPHITYQHAYSAALDTARTKIHGSIEWCGCPLCSEAQILASRMCRMNFGPADPLAERPCRLTCST